VKSEDRAMAILHVAVDDRKNHLGNSSCRRSRVVPVTQSAETLLSVAESTER
jgi:hypothetical protein